MKTMIKKCTLLCVSLFTSCSMMAADQTWISGNANNDWSTSAANWDAGAVWVNGNNAIFGGSGEVVDVNGSVSVGNITFNVFGYEIGDATSDGAFTLSGSPSVISVSSGTNIISEVIAGSGGLTKSGDGVLELTGASSSSTGNTIVSAGKLQFGATDALPSGTITVNDGATLELTTTTRDNANKRTYTISGAGVNGEGAFVNNAQNHGTSVFNSLTLAADATVANSRRTDAHSVTTSGYTLTKIGRGNFNIRSLPGNTMQKLIINEGLAQFEGVSPTITDGVIVNTNGFLSIMSNNTDRDLNADVTLNSGALVANWYLQTPAETTIHCLKPVTASGDSSLIIGVASPLVNDENSGKSHLNIESGLKGTGTLTCNPDAICSPGDFRIRLLSDNSGFKGTLVIDEGNVDVGATDGGTAGTLNDGPVSTVDSASWLWFNRTDSQSYTNTFSGNGHLVFRHDGDATFDGNTVGCGYIDVANASLTLANGAALTLSQTMAVGDKNRQTDDSTIIAELNIADGCSLSTLGIVAGNDYTSVGVADYIRATINQTGGTVNTTGDAGEGNGLRLAHYPAADNVYNMSGGSLTIGGGQDLGIATDGTGLFNMTGGDVYTTRVMMNERTGAKGYGTLEISGGTLHLGSGGIVADSTAPYEVTLGNGGGIIKATADCDINVTATLSGSGSDALTFDGDEHTLRISGLLCGTGDFVVGGTGTVAVTGYKTYTGKTVVNSGSLCIAAGAFLSGSEQVEVGSGAVLELQSPVSGLRDDASITVVDDSDSSTGVNIASGVEEVVGSLTLGGVLQAAQGSYGSSSSGADYVFDEYFSGGGVVRLGTAGLYWDGSDTTGNADGGNGNWDTVLTNWNDAATAGADIVWSNASPMYAIFGGAAGTVNVEDTIEFGLLSFKTDGYTVSDLDDDGTLRLAGLSVLSADSNVTVEISEQLTGTNGLIKTGAGVVTLSGTNTATLSGQVYVNEGTLRWGDFYGLPPTTADKPITVADGATLDLGGLSHFDVSRHYNISGWGVNNVGAFYKSGPGTIYGNWATDSVNLLADSAIGGAVRVDIYGLNLNGFKVTKVGPSALRLYETFNTSGGFDINGGTVYFENVNQVFEGPIVVKDGRYLGFYVYYNASRSFTADITLNGGRVFAGGQSPGDTDTSWYGSIVVNGEGSILCGATESGEYLPGDPCNMHVYSGISGTGALYINRSSITPAGSNDSFVNLYADNSFTGTVTIGRGLCTLKEDAALRGASQIELETGVTLDIQNPGDTLGDEVVLVIPDDSDTATGITLTNGVYEMVHRVILGGTSYGPGSGSFGSTSSTADHQDDEYFSGTGVVYVPEAQGTLIILR